MSMARLPRRLPAFRPATFPPEICARHFGELIRHCRELDGRPVEELTSWAGLTPEGWKAIEAGEVLPIVLEQVLLMAAVLQLGDSWLAPLLSLAAGTSQN
jgi:hypothetical protein